MTTVRDIYAKLDGEFLGEAYFHEDGSVTVYNEWEGLTSYCDSVEEALEYIGRMACDGTTMKTSAIFA